MGSLEDLTTLKALVAADPALDEGLDHYCVLVGEYDDRGEWTDCPPRPGAVFAHDGSEHEFCLLENGAVVAYTPLSDTPYVVVGADLREFLALLLHGNGAQIGYLGYDRDEAVADLAGPFDPDDEVDDDEQHALDRLTETFGLERWADVGARLDELQSLLST